jgi:hypothetical protein
VMVDFDPCVMVDFDPCVMVDFDPCVMPSSLLSSCGAHFFKHAFDISLNVLK